MVLMCLPSDALLQHLPSYLGFSYPGRGVSLHGSSSKVQPLLLTLDEGYLLTATPPDLEHGIAPLGPPATAATAPWKWGCSSRRLPLASDWGYLLLAATPTSQVGYLLSAALYAPIAAAHAMCTGHSGTFVNGCRMRIWFVFYFFTLTVGICREPG